MNTTSSEDFSAVSIVLPGPSWARTNAICIDTATTMAAIALVEHGEVVAEQTWRTGMAHTRQLTATLRTLAAETGFQLRDVDMICVCTGPGSFNGIRTGMATALGLAYGLDTPIYGKSSLDTLAFAQAERTPVQRALLSAGRGEFYSALFGTRAGRWRRLSPYTIGSLEALAAESPDKCLWCGTITIEEMERLAALLGGSKRIVSPPHSVRRAAYLLPLALAEAAAGAPGTPDALQALYLRRPAITTPRTPDAAGV